MPITRHNRVIKQHSTDKKNLTKEKFLKLLDELIAENVLKGAVNNNANLQFDDAQLVGTLDQIRSEISQIQASSELMNGSASFTINANPRKTLSISFNLANLQVSFNANNFQKNEAKPLVDIFEKTYPVSKSSSHPEIKESTIKEKSYLPGPFAPTELSTSVSDKKVFVIMSFKPEHRDAYFVAIEPTLKKLGFNPIRVDQIQHNKTVTSEIVNQIEKAAFVIGDLTGESPNVYYEIGWAHRADKEVVLTSKKGTAVHFDVSAINRIEYEDYTELCSALEKRIRGISERLGLTIEE